MTEVILNKYYVVSVGQTPYVNFITGDDTLSDINWALRFQSREKAVEYRDWIRETYVGKVEVAEINLIAKIDNN